MPKLEKIHVDQLRTGMYVSQLDRPWLDTPFLLQGFEVSDYDDIRMVSQYCEYVYIDSEQERGSSHSSGEGTLKRSAPPLPPIENTVPVEEEHKRLSQYYQKARGRALDLYHGIRSGEVIDQEAIQQTVDECLDSVLRNPDALVLMSQIRQESEYTAEHSLRVCVLAITFGRHLGYEKKQLETLGLCGLLHDIGKMRVPVAIVDKPGPLTTKEFKMMKAHTVHGRNLLLSTPNIESVVIDTAYSHHERMDGAGYPRKLAGAEISRFAKIISIVDAYDAMTSDRCYSRAKTTTQALKSIYEERGRQFDEELAIQFIKVIGLFPVGCIVELYNGEIGVVVETNRRRRHLPRILIIRDAEGRRKEEYQIKDLIYIEEGDLPNDYLIKQVLPDGSFGIFLQDLQKEGVFLKC